jgi:signal transduction histidine kinase
VGLYLLRHLHRAERANEELELAIAGKTRLLETSFALLRDSERSGARVAERERIMREMHDGLGAQLMTALRGMERGALGKEEVAQSLQEGLDELRLLMDSGDSTQALQTALANWRNRWDARLAATGLTLHWTIDDTLDDLTLSGDTVFQLMRILQEGVTNIVKHAQARNLSMRASVATVAQVPCLCLELLDDGKGLGSDPLRAGARGLKNMHYRAQQIGAQITVESLNAPAHGCRVRLHLPLPAIIVKKGL